MSGGQRTAHAGTLPRLAIWGAGGHAKVVAETVQRLGGRVEGFLDGVDPARRGEVFFGGAAVLGGREALAGLRRGGVGALVLAFGANRARLALGAELGAEGWGLPTVVDPGATISADASIGEGSYVAAGAVIQPGARIGAFCIVNSGAIVEHDVRLGAGVHLGPRACLAGHAEVGRGSFIGAGAIVRDRVRIGADVIVGIGALVLADIADGVVAYGHPARVVRGNPP